MTEAEGGSAGKSVFCPDCGKAMRLGWVQLSCEYGRLAWADDTPRRGWINWKGLRGGVVLLETEGLHSGEFRPVRQGFYCGACKTAFLRLNVEPEPNK